ncbi:hypothetical protein M409DRAFT_63745 [Zasmidium cellare ATCC 36951]|uniref:mRNA cap guanine-N(7) methyltransferase n=1 Tax=Zasmidium cellare ATCC 36951 TaxID=1080233 RepID=A0A6A6CWL6_ZASCE|nr:uncharacterized protein M409DRAFT_63745 [Zasmidium cellare ATCC 36951]KAF2171501.1 hypothetical protein M409DRAFT_63745 [Zasmidium cellare ATCC 36951]
MPSEEPPPTDTTQRRIAAKRKRETPTSRANKASKTGTPNAYSRRTPPPQDPTQADDEDGDKSPPRQLKRPGGGSRIAAANREAVERQRKQREEETRKKIAERQLGGTEIIAEHYNSVPERGREWRQAESKISGLRSLNNWIKSTLIQKFSRPEIPTRDLNVLDMACGKGGDLGKWEKAPQVPVLYVGCDIAAVSIEQAQERYRESQRRGRGRYQRGPPMQAEFYVQDTFGHSLAEIPIIRQVGFNPNAGPGNTIIQPGMMGGGFDVVSMMFALHYSFESEDLARGMLRNVAGALKKGGRFFGVMPNSDVIATKVRTLLSNGSPDAAPVSSTPAEDEDDWDPEKPSDSNAAANGDDDDDDWDPEKPSGPVVNGSTPAENPEASKEATTNGAEPKEISWKNDLYSVRFPPRPPLARDGTFRPPFGWKYHYHLEEAVEAPEFVVPWEAFRALAEDYGLELLYRKGFREVFEDESADRELGMLAERMKVLDRDRSKPNGGLLVREDEMEAAAFYHAFCFYKT